MWVRFVTEEQAFTKVVEEGEYPSLDQAVKQAEQLAGIHGVIELWMPKYVVVKSVVYKCFDYGNYKQNKDSHG